ncbi:MAG TPA: DUF502 domain-containing protein [Candidatus Ozemobacteraceae bacterium]
MSGRHRDRLREGVNLVLDGMKALHDILRSYFFTGVILVVPAFVTLFIMYQLFMFADGFLGDAVSRLVGTRVPGFGVISTVLLFVIAGRVAQNVIGKQVLKWVDRSLEKVPIVRSLYAGVKQVSDVVLQQHRGEFKRVVLVEYPKEDSWAVGFVTGDFQVDAVPPFAEQRMICIFVPTTPNPTSGFLLVVDRSKIREVQISIEDAMKLVISGGLVKPSQPGGTPVGIEGEDFTIPH